MYKEILENFNRKKELYENVLCFIDNENNIFIRKKSKKERYVQMHLLLSGQG